VKHLANGRFWQSYHELPEQIQRLADANFQLLKANPRHPSLRFKKINETCWSARVGIHYRALALKIDEDFVWFWIGHHTFYDSILKQL